MSHANTVIVPSPGLTVLTGPNNCGKSAVVVALQILANNENSTYVMRHGARETRIAVETGDGHRVEWRRKRSGGPAYLVDGKPFDRLNQSVPQEVRAALRIAPVASRTDGGGREFDLHFGAQKSPVFLLDEPGTVIAQFFASSSDAEKLVRMQQLHRDKVRLSRSEISRLEAEKARLDRELEALASVGELSEEALNLEREYGALRAEGDRAAAVRQSRTAIERERRVRLLAAGREKALEALSPPPVLRNTDGLTAAVADLRASGLRLARARLMQSRLAGLSPPPELASSEPLRLMIAQLKRARTNVAERSTAVARAERSLADAHEALAQWVSSIKRCPHCGGELNVEHVIEAVGAVE